MVAVPLPLSVKVTPLGRLPLVRLIDGRGVPVVVTVNVPAVPTTNVALATLENAALGLTIVPIPWAVLMVAFTALERLTKKSTLPTMLQMTRAAAHPNVAPMFDCYHFWSGLNKLEDLDLLHTGEIAHVHFQDVPDMQRELLDNSTRFIPGDGVSPLTIILRKLAEKGYSGPLSVELFLTKFQQGDPYEVAREIRQKAESVMRRARVM